VRAVILTLAAVECRAYARAHYPFVWYFVLPAAASLILGPRLGGLESFGATGRVTLGFAVMFSYMSVNYTGRALYREYVSGTWRRTAIAAPPRAAYLIGKCVPVFAITLIQLAAFAAVAFLLLELPLRAGALAGSAQLALVLVPMAGTGVAIGAALFTITRQAEVFLSFTYLLLFVLAALGGAIVPSAELPMWSRLAGYATPHYWAMRALDEATRGDGGWAVVLESASVLALFTAVLMGAAVGRLDLRRVCHAA